MWNEKEQRPNYWTTAFWTAFIVVAILGFWLALASAVWGLKVATAGIYGRGEAHRQIESGNNRIEKQELFEGLYADIRAYDDQIQVAAETNTKSPTERNAQNLQGLKLVCIDATNDYNAEARKVSSEQFRASDLPPQIDSFDPDFDCKEDKR